MLPGRSRLFPVLWMSTPVTLAGSKIFSIITPVCLVYNVILNVLTVAIVPSIMGSVYA
jgi:hypothetical protein